MVVKVFSKCFFELQAFNIQQLNHGVIFWLQYFFCQNVNVEHKVGESLVKEPVSIWAFLKGRFQTVGAGKGERGGGVGWGWGVQRCNGNIPMVSRAGPPASPASVLKR